jgi:hypothetical protein
MIPRWGSTPWHTDWPIVSHKVTLTMTHACQHRSLAHSFCSVGPHCVASVYNEHTLSIFSPLPPPHHSHDHFCQNLTLPFCFICFRIFGWPFGWIGAGSSEGLYPQRTTEMLTHIHALHESGTPDPSVWAAEDTKWTRPWSHCNQRSSAHFK